MQSQKRKKAGKILLIIIAAVLLFSAAFFGFLLSKTDPAEQTVQAYQNTYSKTRITVAEDGGVEILPADRTENRPGIIFYVGALIEPEAYIPLLARLAEQGYPCFISDFAGSMAPMEPAAAEEIMRAHPEIGSWYLAGHSLGGVTASGFVDDHRDLAKGLILIASYTNRDLSGTDLSVISVYGDTDGVLNMEQVVERRSWYPADYEEHVIPGANHAQFGDYGKQDGDLEANITAGEQQAQTAEILLDWLSRH